MNYYERHIGDYIKSTVRLSMLEDGAYNRLIDEYYQSEQPLPADLGEVYRIARAYTEDERKAVDYVLKTYFKLDAEGYRQKRIDSEIERYADKQRKAKASAEARWSKSKGNADATENGADGMRTHTEGNAHQTPDTRHQTPSESTDACASYGADKPKKKQGSEEDHQAARWMFERVQKINPAAKQPNWDGWANDVRLMREIDGRDHKAICEMFDWANKDSFWCANILSPGKLRDQWDKLTVRRGTSAASKQSSNHTNFKDKDYGQGTPDDEIPWLNAPQA